MKAQSREKALARALGVAAMTCLLATMACLLVSAQAIAAPHVRVGGMVREGAGSAPTDAQCRAAGFGPCYSPQEIRTAYGLNKLIDAGMVGSGQTIVLIESYGSPTVAADLQTFDKDYGLPDPPSLQVLRRSAPFPSIQPTTLRSVGRSRPRWMFSGHTPSHRERPSSC